MFHIPISSPQRIRIFGCFEAEAIVSSLKFTFLLRLRDPVCRWASPGISVKIDRPCLASPISDPNESLYGKDRSVRDIDEGVLSLLSVATNAFCNQHWRGGVTVVNVSYYKATRNGNLYEPDFHPREDPDPD
jgi:hypothetical protein